MSTLAVHPVTEDNWDDFAGLFAAKGGPHYCYCTPYRFSDAQALSNVQKKGRMRRLVAGGTPIGVLAYDGDAPVGWCSIAPRETYVKLERSRTMPRSTPAGVATWTVLCFFVPRSRRQQGITQVLLKGAVAYARAQGAREVEGYPFDSAGISSSHRGHSSVFASAGFEQDGRRWWRKL